MKRKVLASALLLLIILLGPIFISICSCGEDPKEYYFENVNVFVVGRCRTICSDGTWLGGLFSGNLKAADAMTDNEPLERFRVIVYNESIFHPHATFSRLYDATVGVRYANGVFFWSAKGNGISIFPPAVFIWCHAEKVWIFNL